MPALPRAHKARDDKDATLRSTAKWRSHGRKVATRAHELRSCRCVDALRLRYFNAAEWRGTDRRIQINGVARQTTDFIDTKYN